MPNSTKKDFGLFKRKKIKSFVIEEGRWKMVGIHFSL